MLFALFESWRKQLADEKVRTRDLVVVVVEGALPRVVVSCHSAILNRQTV